jgi:hypothetical protein
MTHINYLIKNVVKKPNEKLKREKKGEILSFSDKSRKAHESIWFLYELLSTIKMI